MSVVIGASSRLGKAIVTRLAFAGHRVVGIDSNSEQLRNIGDEMKSVGADVHCFPFQENEESTMAKAADLLGGMRGLVFAPPDNQIFGNVADASEASQLDFNTVFAQRLTLPFRIIKRALPHLRQSNDSSIVIINSSSAYTTFLNMGLFSSASTALLSLSRALAIDPSILPTRVNTVVMSTVHGDGSGGIWDNDENETLREMMPLGRLGSVADVSSTVEFLLSTKSRYITGESFILSGGMQLRL
ncbi:hypothetical protein PRIPAC_84303 [Pristionchus pacificus]|nr:hypothetical protein PRIPAC_84303 [Pristionchus pacificus]